MSTAITATGEKPLTSAALRELSARSNLPGAVRAVSHYGAIGVFATLIWLVSSTYGLAWALPLIVVQGYFVAFLFMVVHETAHKTAFRSRALNLVLGICRHSRSDCLTNIIACSTGTIIATRRIRTGIRNCWLARSPPRIRNSHSPIPVFGRSPSG
jgi:hypothetical protein